MVRSIQLKPESVFDWLHHYEFVRRLDFPSIDVVNVEDLTIKEVRQVAGLTIQA